MATTRGKHNPRRKRRFSLQNTRSDMLHACCHHVATVVVVATVVSFFQAGCSNAFVVHKSSTSSSLSSGETILQPPLRSGESLVQKPGINRCRRGAFIVVTDAKEGFALLRLEASASSNESERSRSESPLRFRRRLRSVLARSKETSHVNGAAEESRESFPSPVISTAPIESLLCTPTGANGTPDKNGHAAARQHDAQREASGSAITLHQGVTSSNSVDSDVSNDASTTTRPINGDTSGINGDTSSVNGFAKAKAEKTTPPSLPFPLPELNEEQLALLESGERLQEQSKMGREGNGFVALDVNAPQELVWEALLDFPDYPELIDTVRAIRITSIETKDSEAGNVDASNLSFGEPSVIKASFVLSKFRLNIAAIHRYTPNGDDGDYMIFSLDPASTNVVLKFAQGIWYTQPLPKDENGQDRTRVWLLCELKVSRILPMWIVDYAARRAMPRATKWLRPYVEFLAASKKSER